MKVQFGDLKSHYSTYKEQIDAAVARVLASGYFILGPELAAFERQFEEFLGLPENRVVGCNSGTDAIYLALAAALVGPEHEVLVPSHTAVPTICAIRSTGATPVFVDICPRTYTIDVEQIEEKVTPKTKAIVPVHLYGQTADMDKINAIATRHGLTVVEDCAQSTGAKYKGRQSGTIGDYGAFSFYPSKNLGAFGDGGAVCCKSKEDYDRLIKIRNYGQSKRYYNDIEGVNSRLDEIQAAILGAQVEFVKGWNGRRREIAARYDAGLKELVVTPEEASFNEHVYHLYVIESSYRDELHSFLLERDVQTLIHYPVPAHLQDAYRYLNYSKGSLPRTESAVERILSLPMYPGLTDEQIDFVIEAIAEFYKTRKVETLHKEQHLDVDRKPDQVASSVG